MKYRLRRTCLVGLLALISIIALQACRSERVAVPTVSIQSISPANDIPILTGEKLSIEVSGLAYNIPDGAISSLIVQSASGEVLGTAQPIKIKSGERFKLNVDVTVPPTASVNANIAVYKDTTSDSIAVDWRDYKVVGLKK